MHRRPVTAAIAVFMRIVVLLGRNIPGTQRCGNPRRRYVAVAAERTGSRRGGAQVMHQARVWLICRLVEIAVRDERRPT